LFCFYVAVAKKAGMLNASVLENGSYGWKTVEAITLKSLLVERFQLTLIDYLFMDIEGAEYHILPQLSNDNLDQVIIMFFLN
jgi:FkbM family methyltransferase